MSDQEQNKHILVNEDYEKRNNMKSEEEGKKHIHWNGNQDNANTISLLAKNDEELIKALDHDRKEKQDENEIENSDDNTGNRSLIKRMLGPMEAGSVRGSIFAISSWAWGTGCLSWPLRFTQLSLTWALVFLIFGASIAYWSLTIMIHAARHSKEKDYSRLVKESLGPIPAVLLDLIILLYIFGVWISYQVIIYSLIGRVFFEFLIKDMTFEEFNNKTWDTYIYKFPIMFGLVCIWIPMCLLKDISKMRFTSMFSICSLFYVICVIVIESPIFYKNYMDNVYKESDPTTHPNFFDWSKAFGSDIIFFPCLATIFFSFTCHAGAFPVYKTLKNNISRRINKVFRRSIILDCAIYIFVGISGFWTAPTSPPSLIIYRESILKNDIFMTIAKIGIVWNLMLSTPANYNAFRISFFELVWNTNEIPKNRNLLVTIPTLLITTTIGAWYTNIISYITWLGGFCSVIITFLMPGLLYVKNNDYPLTHWRNIGTLATVTILCTIGFTAGIQTIIL